MVMTPRRKKTILIAAGLLIAFMGAVDVLEAVVGNGRRAAGKLFFDKEQVAELVAEAKKQHAPFVAACADVKTAERFDSSSVKKLDKWCKAVNRFDDEPGVESAMGLLKANNLYLARVSDLLYSAGGEPAYRSLALLEAQSAAKPHLDEIASISAGAAFSQFIIGVVFLVVGAFLFFFGRRRSA